VTPTPTLSPTPSPTPGLTPVSARLIATDPRTVKLTAGKPQLVTFFAYWCGTCLAMAPTLKGLEAGYINRVIFTYLDIDDPVAADLKYALRFRAEPEYFLLDADGRIVKRWADYVTIAEFQTWLDEAVK
jgi:thiol-disulfide isomerase/thioredoxin